jgi:hypothetical protein
MLKRKLSTLHYEIFLGSITNTLPFACPSRKVNPEAINNCHLHRTRRGGLVEVFIVAKLGRSNNSRKKPNTKVEKELDCTAIKTRKPTTLCGMKGEGSTSAELLI